MNREERIARDGLREDPIEFYRPSGDYGWMSNFSPHPVDYSAWGRGVEGHTAENLFQAMKALYTEDYRAFGTILGAPTPSEAKKLGRTATGLPAGWDTGLSWLVMVEILHLKLIRNPELVPLLMGTGERAIWEDSPTDDIWGIRYRADYRGKNGLGNAWMRVRHNLSVIDRIEAR